MSDSEIGNFCPDQDRTRVYGEAYFRFAAAENPNENAEQSKKGHLLLLLKYYHPNRQKVSASQGIYWPEIEKVFLG